MSSAGIASKLPSADQTPLPAMAWIVVLPEGETRRFLENGDEVILRGRAERSGFASIGFGECRGVILAADCE